MDDLDFFRLYCLQYVTILPIEGVVWVGFIYILSIVA